MGSQVTSRLSSSRLQRSWHSFGCNVVVAHIVRVRQPTVVLAHQWSGPLPGQFRKNTPVVWGIGGNNSPGIGSGNGQLPVLEWSAYVVVQVTISCLPPGML